MGLYAVCEENLDNQDRALRPDLDSDLAPAITNFILDENWECCDNNFSN